VRACRCAGPPCTLCSGCPALLLGLPGFGLPACLLLAATMHLLFMRGCCYCGSPPPKETHAQLKHTTWPACVQGGRGRGAAARVPACAHRSQPGVSGVAGAGGPAPERAAGRAVLPGRPERSGAGAGGAAGGGLLLQAQQRPALRRPSRLQGSWASGDDRCRAPVRWLPCCWVSGGVTRANNPVHRCLPAAGARASSGPRPAAAAAQPALRLLLC
jgi:hypothetical protein